MYLTHTQYSNHRRVCHRPLPPPTGIRHPFRLDTHVLHIVGNTARDWFLLFCEGDEFCCILPLLIEGIFFPTPTTSDASSATVHCWLLFNPAWCASSENRGRCRARMISFDLRWGGYFGCWNTNYHEIEGAKEATNQIKKQQSPKDSAYDEGGYWRGGATVGEWQKKKKIKSVVGLDGRQRAEGN